MCLCSTKATSNAICSDMLSSVDSITLEYWYYTGLARVTGKYICSCFLFAKTYKCGSTLMFSSGIVCRSLMLFPLSSRMLVGFIASVVGYVYYTRVVLSVSCVCGYSILWRLSLLWGLLMQYLITACDI